MTAPMHREDPAGEQISVGFITLPARGAKKGTIFYNPGGPGGSNYATMGGPVFEFPRELRENYDIVGVEPRGLEGSTPVDCDVEAAANAPVTEQLSSGGALTRRVCGPAYATSLTTDNNASDWDAVRVGLGLPSIDIIGLSYGTVLGSRYATLYPEHTGKVVLDSGLPPEQFWGSILVEQVPRYLSNLYTFFGWAANNDDTYHLGDTPLKVYNAWAQKIFAESGTTPTVAPPPAQPGDMDPAFIPLNNAVAPHKALADNFFNQAVHGGNQSTSPTLGLSRILMPQSWAWAYLASMLSGYTPTPGIEELQGPDEAQKLAMQSQLMQGLMICNENLSGTDPSRIPAFYWNSFVSGDIFWLAANSVASGVSCNGAQPVVDAIPLDGSRLAYRPLEIQGTDDPQTPYHLYGPLAKRMNSQVVTVDGYNHGWIGFGYPAIDKLVVDYFRTGQATTDHITIGLPTAALAHNSVESLAAQRG
ncbi:alpha/beta fold hydrolase [Corynebacterium pyruviciproducens]|uniref:alpha/beta fold hydrolase n=1 Tax=Corynebacterium pyruviciproducens TaxID=598660 RepID=UPI00254A75DB|nr:alpha/beta fold hydrolase [Corynebacterium pyruviciproducens]MDK7213854.1 alpha/beta fold hydrolase [Corynebacterium pyruviciproducens]